MKRNIALKKGEPVPEPAEGCEGCAGCGSAGNCAGGIFPVESETEKKERD